MSTATTNSQQQRFSFRTITTKYATKCRRCDQAIPVGTKVRWAQRSGTYHLTAECPRSSGTSRLPGAIA